MSLQLSLPNRCNSCWLPAADVPGPFYKTKCLHLFCEKCTITLFPTQHADAASVTLACPACGTPHLERELVELTLGDGNVALQRRATINLRSAIHSDPCHWMAELQSALAFQLAQQRQESIRQERLAGKKDVQREEFVARLQAKVRQLSNRVSEHEHESGVKDRKLAASAREAERLRNMLEDAQVSETLSLSLSFSRARLLVAARLTPPHPPSPFSLSLSQRKQRNMERILEVSTASMAASGTVASTSASASSSLIASDASPGAMPRPMIAQRELMSPMMRTQQQRHSPRNLNLAAATTRTDHRVVQSVDATKLTRTESGYFSRARQSGGPQPRGIFRNRRAQRPKTPGMLF